MTGHDGKPIELAHVHVSYDGDTKSFEVNKNGKFELTVNHSGSLKLEFTGINYQSEEVNLIKFDDKDIIVDVKLSPNIFDDSDTALKVTGDFNDYNFDSGKQLKQDNGKYYAEVKNDDDTLFYQILGFAKRGSGRRQMDRSVNGTMQDGYKYDGGGDYRGFIVTDKEKVRIEFDPSVFPNKKTESYVKFRDTNTKEYIEIVEKLNKIKNKFYMDYSLYMQKKIYDKLDSLKTAKISEIEKVFDEAGSESSKIKAALEYQSIASFGQSNKLKDETNPEIFKYVLNLIPPKSDFWLTNHYDLFWLIAFVEEPDKSDYFKKIISSNIDGNVKASLLSKAINYYYRKPDSTNGRKYYNMLQENYYDTRYARNAKREHSPNKKIVKGKQLPQFKLMNIDDQDDSISTDMLKGKYVLIDVWGTWCGPCIMEMKHLHNAYIKFKDKNFTIFSIALDSSPKNVIKFREGKWNMPWMHAYGGPGFDAEIFDNLEVTGVPKAFLVNPEGGIIVMEKEKLNLLVSISNKVL